MILSLSVNGNPAATDKSCSGLVVAYCYSQSGPNGNTVAGTTSQGSDLINGFTTSESVEFEHNGEGVISAGTTGGVYRSEWNYDAMISIYKID